MAKRAPLKNYKKSIDIVLMNNKKRRWEKQKAEGGVNNG